MQLCAVVSGLSEERAALASYAVGTMLTTLGLPHQVVAEPPDPTPGHLLLWYSPAEPPADAAALVHVACFDPPTPDGPIHRAACLEDRPRVAFLGAHRHVRGRRLYRAVTDGRAVVAANGPHVRIGFDLIASAAFWLTGGDETSDRHDHFGRVRGTHGPRHDAGLAATPVVTDLMNLLWACIRRAAFAAGRPLARVAPWPAESRFALFLSHDIDLWKKRTVRQFVKEILRSGKPPRTLGEVFRTFFTGPDPWALGPIADLEAQRGMHSTFYILAGRPTRHLHGEQIVNGYPVLKRTVRRAVRALDRAGWEIGLHGSFDSHRSAASLEAERKDLERLVGKPVVGTRQHFLRFERPGTWRRQAEAGLCYDASLGYHDLDGYRAGFSFPFRPFDGEPLPLLALPLIVMDGALYEHQHLDSKDAWPRVRHYLERTRRDGAMLSLLWHNTPFCDLDAPGYRGVYERALDWAREHNGWGAAAGEIVRWWERRAATSLDVRHRPSVTRVRVSAPPELDAVPVELRFPDHWRVRVAFEACRGRVLTQGAGTVRCLLEALVPGAAAVVLRRV